MHAHFPKLKLRKFERSIPLGKNTRFSNNKQVNCWNTEYRLYLSYFYILLWRKYIYIFLIDRKTITSARSNFVWSSVLDSQSITYTINQTLHYLPE